MKQRLEQIEIHEIIKNNLPLGFSVVDLDGIIVDFNVTAEKITGYSREEVIGKSHYDILHGTSDAEACPLLQHALSHRREAVETVSYITKKNGGNVILSVTTFPLIDEEGDFLGGVELFRDITAVKKMERERKNLLSMFAHDMKNPVLTTGGLISRLLTGKAGSLSPKQKEYLNIMQDSMQRVESFIMDFLDFSKIETKEYKPVFEYFDLTKEIQRIVKQAKIEADKKNIMIRYDPVENKPVMIHADQVMLDRVITNLIGNAIKYTGPGGTIKIELFDREKSVLVQVTDTGIGIAEKHLLNIFDAFFSVSRNSSGSGLGLAIAKTIIEAHGGRIWVDSSNAGSSFHFLLPKNIRE